MWDQATRSICEFDYITDMPTVTTVICTILMVGFTVFLEIAVHGRLDCCTTISNDSDQSIGNSDATSREALLPTIVIEQPQSYTLPQVNAPQPNADNQALPIDQKQPSVKPGFSCYSNPSPNVRANRLTTAVFLYAVVLTAFIIRMHDIDDPYIRPECSHYVWKGMGSIPEPNWWVVVLLNILPLIAASFSVMRTVVDCLLVRWNKSLGYEQSDRDAFLTWTPCMPVYLVYVGVRGLLKWPITLLMGRPRSSVLSAPRTETRRTEDLEMQSEETRRLVDDVEGGEDEQGERSDEPPAYYEVTHHNSRVRTDIGKRGAALA